MVGAELAAARRGLGLTLEDLSERTKISVERLRAIEETDVSQLPSLVYLKGFVREYAKEVDLDADETVLRYMDDVDQVWLRNVDIQLSAIDSPGAPSEPEPLTMPSMPLPESTFPDEERIEKPLAALPAEMAAEPVLFNPVEPSTDSPRYEEDSFDEFESPGAPVIPAAAVARRPPYGLIALVAAAAVVGGYVLASNLGRFTQAPAQSTASVEETRRDRAGQDDKPDVAAASQPLSSSGAAAIGDDATRTDARRGPGTEQPEPAARLEATPEPRAPDVGSPVSAPIQSPQNKRAAGRPPVEQRNRVDKRQTAASAGARRTPAATTRDLTGAWTLTNRVASSSVARFNNLNLGYRIQLKQNGNKVTGTGLKWMENGRTIAARNRTPISVQGTLNNDRLQLTFTERGARRTSGGTFVLEVADGETLRGTFESDAANSKGSTLARRERSSQR